MLKQAPRLSVAQRASEPTKLEWSRTHLPKVCRWLGYTRGAEIGVWKGAFSARFCKKNPQMRWYAVDSWLSYPAWLDTKNAMPADKAAAFMAESYAEAQLRLGPYSNCTMLRMFSVDAAKTLPDASLDIVYIDGNHTFEAVTEDLEAWTPKVKRGGLISGHDYRAFTNKPTIHVIEAVQAFVRRHQIAPWYLLAGDRTPSFLWVKL
jgi:hypothetical protein